MTCCEVVEFLMHYLDGELPEEQRAVFEAHLRRCPPCVAYLESYQISIQMVKIVHRASCPEKEHALPEELVRAVLTAARQQV
jgi:anti-sigma factor RsiW